MVSIDFPFFAKLFHKKQLSLVIDVMLTWSLSPILALFRLLLSELCKYLVRVVVMTTSINVSVVRGLSSAR